MKEITAEEAQKLLKLEGRSTLVRSRVQAMAVGAFLIIEPSDWHQQNGPRHMISRLEKKENKRFKVNRLQQGGWLVERVG